jgi:NADH dehydrogenase FAD-containing subunit
MCTNQRATLSTGSQQSLMLPPTNWQPRCSRPSVDIDRRTHEDEVVIVGEGFAGLSAVMYLDKPVARRSEAEVVLRDIVNPLRRILRHVKVDQAEVDAVDLRARRFRAWQEFATSGKG